jgi:hypothetical protein
MNSNTETYSVLKLTAGCYITDLLVVCNGKILSGVLKDVELQGQQPCIVDLNLLNHYQQAQLFS